MTRRSAAVVAACLAAACSGSSTDSPEDPRSGPESPYPAVTVAGTVRDVRGALVASAQVAVENAFDSATGVTAADGSFVVTVDGSDDPSALEISHPSYRTRRGTIPVGASGAALGTVEVLSKEEILFRNATTEVYLARTTDPLVVTTLASVVASKWTPCFSPWGEPKVRWAKVGTDEIEEARWDGSGVTTVRGSEPVWNLQGIDWAERGTILWRQQQADAAVKDVRILEDPPGQSFAYGWQGFDAAASPPSFEWMSAAAAPGQMVAYAAADGIYTAFPYLADSYLVPLQVPGTQAGDSHPAWSTVRADGSLLLGFLRDGRLFLSQVTAGTGASVYSTPVGVYGNVATAASEEPKIFDFAWAPPTDGRPDRIVLSVLDVPKPGVWDFGDVLVFEMDPSGVVTGAPTRVYSRVAQGHGNARDVAWR